MSLEIVTEAEADSEVRGAAATSMKGEGGGRRTGSLGAASAASMAADLASSLVRVNDSFSTISLLIALNRFTLLHLIDFAILACIQVILGFQRTKGLSGCFLYRLNLIEVF